MVNLALFSPFRFYLVYIGSIQSSLVFFSSNWSYLVLFSLFCPLWSIRSYFVHFHHIRFTLVLFNLLWSYLVHLGLTRSIRSPYVLFGPFYLLSSYSVHSIHFGPIQIIRSYSVHFGRIRSYLAHSGPIGSICFYSVHIGLCDKESFYLMLPTTVGTRKPTLSYKT